MKIDAMPWLGQTVGGISLQKLGFNPRALHAKFVAK
jgi:hypothetical protein